MHLSTPLAREQSARFDTFLQKLQDESPAFSVYDFFTPEEIAFARGSQE